MFEFDFSSFVEFANTGLIDSKGDKENLLDKLNIFLDKAMDSIGSDNEHEDKIAMNTLIVKIDLLESLNKIQEGIDTCNEALPHIEDETDKARIILSLGRLYIAKGETYFGAKILSLLSKKHVLEESLAKEVNNIIITNKYNLDLIEKI